VEKSFILKNCVFIENTSVVKEHSARRLSLKLKRKKLQRMSNNRTATKRMQITVSNVIKRQITLKNLKERQNHQNPPETSRLLAAPIRIEKAFSLQAILMMP
jgi:hypothetical protein